MEASEPRILYRDREEWKDITPLPLPQTAGDPFAVEYTELYEDLMGYFLAVLKVKEISLRALDITNEVIAKFPAHYTAWWYKFFILESIGYNAEKLLDELSAIIKKSPKSYQAWHYRQWIMEREKECIDEIAFFKEVFDIDAKNFHAWSYAIWYADNFNQHQAIYDLAVDQIRIDMRNNSAWNARKTMSDKLNKPPSEEFQAAYDSLMIITKNEAAVNYAYAMVEKDTSLTEKLVELGNVLVEKNPQNPFGLGIQLYLASKSNDSAKIQELCAKLTEADPIRHNYYSLVSQGKIKYA